MAQKDNYNQKLQFCKKKKCQILLLIKLYISDRNTKRLL